MKNVEKDVSKILAKNYQTLLSVQKTFKKTVKVQYPPEGHYQPQLINSQLALLNN